MPAWLKRVLGLTSPTRREMAAYQNHLDGLETRVEYVYSELKKLRGRVYADERPRKPREDAPGDTNGDEPGIRLPTPPRAALIPVGPRSIRPF